jgi:hypothetical protein
VNEVSDPILKAETSHVHVPVHRRNGKPTSLGCFDEEEQAARAYDKMMLWCELHNTSGVKGGGITNFDPTEYEKDLAWLQSVTQVYLLGSLQRICLSPCVHASAQASCLLCVCIMLTLHTTALLSLPCSTRTPEPMRRPLQRPSAPPLSQKKEAVLAAGSLAAGMPPPRCCFLLAVCLKQQRVCARAQEELVQASRSEGRRQTAHGKAQRVITPEARRERMRMQTRRRKSYRRCAGPPACSGVFVSLHSCFRCVQGDRAAGPPGPPG